MGFLAGILPLELKIRTFGALLFRHGEDFYPEREWSMLSNQCDPIQCDFANEDIWSKTQGDFKDESTSFLSSGLNLMTSSRNA